MHNTFAMRSAAACLLLCAGGVSALAQCPPTFTVSGPWPMGSPYNAAVGDFDRDGKIDLAAANFNGQNVTVRFASIHHPAGTNYEPTVGITIGLNPTTLAVGDFNNDGTTDMACTQINGGAARLAVFISNGNRTFQPPAYYTTTPGMGSFVRAADITRDGITDLIVNVPNGVAVLAGGPGPWTGGGNAAFSTRLFGAIPNTFSLLDLNADGALDLAFPQVDPSAVRVTLGAPPASAAFGAPVTYGTGYFGAGTPAVGDFNGDGRQDVALAHFITGRVQVVHSNGDGSLAPQTGTFAGGGSPQHVAAADFNGDGRIDVAATHNGGVGVHLGDGAGGLTNATNFASSQPNGVTVADMNNDGRPDMVVSSAQSGTYTVFLNTTPVTDFNLDPFDKRVCPGATSSAQFFARATTTQAGGLTGYRWERLVEGAWLQLNEGHVPGLGIVSLSGGTNGDPSSLIIDAVEGEPGDHVATLRPVALTACGANPGEAVELSIIAPCGGADVGATGGVFTGCGDGVLDNNDFVVFIDLFFSGNAIADVGTTGGVPGADGRFDNNDFVVFIDMFFAGCTI
ncbi:MAG TPA: VCBS repeat-containing protein [Phycisphaerales bacterium]|nr:VCBS repeat-containing protein [Phycisphaerales bacterium]